LVTHIYGFRPNVKLYLASIIPMVNHESDVQAFNAAIPGIVTNHQALGHNVVYVPMYDALDINTDLADGLHPNASGYLHMAEAWDAALHPSTNLTVALACPANDQTFTLGQAVSATATVANAAGAYTVHIYTNCGASAFAEAGVGGSSSPYEVSLGELPVGTYPFTPRSPTPSPPRPQRPTPSLLWRRRPADLGVDRLESRPHHRGFRGVTGISVNMGGELLRKGLSGGRWACPPTWPARTAHSPVPSTQASSFSLPRTPPTTPSTLTARAA
jgi:hypothetical protein